MKRAALCAVVLSFSLSPSRPLWGQERIPAAGRVIRAGPDSAPAPGVPLVLHRVGRASQGPIDSTSSDKAGRFRFRFAADTTFLYLISARYAGIEYFSPPINTNPALPDTGLVVTVFDTSSTQPVSQVARYLVIRRPAEDGSRSVLDLIILMNRGAATRLARDTTMPSWLGTLPTGVSGVRVGEADLSAEAIEVRGESLLVFAPIAPGEKQIALEYAVRPGAGLALRFLEDSVAVNILTQDQNTRIEGGDLVQVDSQTIEGQSFRRWVGAPHGGELVRVSFAASTGSVPRWILPALVGGVGAVLLFAVFRFRPRRPPPALETLTDRIAELEAKYAGREQTVSPEEWQQFQAERTRLRAELAATLQAKQARPT